MTGATSTDHDARRNVGLLVAAQALGGSTAAIVISTGGLAGQMLADDKSLATLPVTCFIVGTALATLPANLVMRRLGRRMGYILGCLVGILAGLVAAYAIYVASFWMLAGALLIVGIYWAFVQSYRFAAADAASDAFKAKAISWVLAGGIVAAIVGPQAVIWTKELFQPYLFLGSFLAMSVLIALALPIVALLRIPRPQAVTQSDEARSLGEIARQPRFIVAALCAAVSYAVMSLVMTASPIAMVGCGLSVSDAALGIQWHVMAMYVPSFFTGSLINRFGKSQVVAAGMVALTASALAALSGLGVVNFWVALILLGIGWNFGFIGATAMLTDCYRPVERNKVQGFNDFMVFGLNAAASFSSGLLLSHLGWEAVNLLVFPAVLLCLTGLAWLASRTETALTRGA